MTVALAAWRDARAAAVACTLGTLIAVNWVLAVRVLPGFEAYKPVAPLSAAISRQLRTDDVVAHFGGPVQPQLGTVLFCPTGGNGEDPAASAEVIPGVSLTQHVGTLSHLAVAPPKDFRLLLGYAGWGAGQLVQEILRNDWLTAPAAEGLVFARDSEEVWRQALESVGVDPGALPSWSPETTGDEGAN
jgi:putative transcriptional regulator